MPYHYKRYATEKEGRKSTRTHKTLQRFDTHVAAQEAHYKNEIDELAISEVGPYTEDSVSCALQPVDTEQVLGSGTFSGQKMSFFKG